MIFALITFFAAFSIEAIGTLVSVIGLSTLFGANPIVMTLAVALDVGKLVVVTLLYSYWKELNVLMKTYGLIAAVVTMTITSAGAAGYLSGEFQKAIVGTQEGTLKVQVLKDEQAKLEARKKQIDDQIANLPANYSRSRVTLMKQFEEEQKQVTARLNVLSEELPKMQIAQISTEAKAGPILYIAKAFDISVEEAVKWVILMIIFVFDPLAVFLIIAGNFLLHQHRTKKGHSVTSTDLFADEPSAPTTPIVRKASIEEVAATAPIFEILSPTRANLDRQSPSVVQVGETPEVLAPLEVPTIADTNEVADEGNAHAAEGPDRVPVNFTEQFVDEPKSTREQITKSTLGLVKPDPHTSIGSITEPHEVGYGTGAFTTGTPKK